MIKEDIIRNTMSQLSMDRNQSKMIVEKILDVIKQSLSDGDKVMVSGFGQLKVSHKQPRIGRNPKTKEVHEISARNVVTFYASKVFRSEIQELPK